MLLLFTSNLCPHMITTLILKGLLEVVHFVPSKTNKDLSKTRCHVLNGLLSHFVFLLESHVVIFNKKIILIVVYICKVFENHNKFSLSFPKINF